MIYDLFTSLTLKGDNQVYGCCPLHAEKTPSFTVNTETGEWYCHGCKKGGNDITFIMYYYEMSVDTAQYVVEYYNQHQFLPFPSEETISSQHAELMKHPAEIEQLESYGITQETLKKYKIGFESNRITVPIRCRNGECVNIRKYLPVHRRVGPTKQPKCLNIKGLGGIRYFPYDNLSDDHDEVYIVEGEKDCLSAISQGYNAITSTGGSNIPVREVGLLQDKVVYLMLDNDAVGASTANKYIKLLQNIAKEIYVVKLPKKDFSDVFKTMGAINLDEFTTKAEYEVDVSVTDNDDAVVEEMSLMESEFVDNMNVWMKLKGMSVVGADPKIYTIPSKLCVTCSNMKCNKMCPISATHDGIEVEVDPRQILSFVDANDTAQANYVRNLYNCKSVQATPIEFINAQKVMFQETASFVEGLDDSTFENRYGVYIYNGYRLSPTLKYTMEACRVTDPRSQQNYYVIRKAEQERDFIKPDGMEFIEYFKNIATQCSTIDELIEKHYSVWMPLVGIEGRPDLFASTLLSYLSVTEIKWKGGIIKGWLDTMIIGDTRTGKSQMLQRFVKTLKLGGYINGENSRKTGVVGGVQRFGDSWVVTWGAIPMNDRGLLVVDEASGLSIEDFKELSSVRSSGAVTINKIVKGEARARTRLIWLSNPRSGNNLSEFYWKGFDAFKEFIPVAEDQARFDLVVSAAREDVSQLDGIPEPPDNIDETLNYYRELVNFAWEIRSYEVIIPSSVDEYVQKCAREVGKKYGGGPLIVEVAVHEKIIRLSVAIAILCGSINVNDVVLSKQHVDFAVSFLASTLEKKSFGYAEYIEDSQKAMRNIEQSTNYIRAVCVTYPALSVLLASNSFRGSQMSEVLGLDRGEHAKLLSELLKRGLIHLGKSGYYTPDKFMVEIVKQVSSEQKEVNTNA